MNWFSIGYLAQGNARQQAAYHALQKLGIFETLADYSPVLVGTIPIDIDIPSSDLDILLEAQDLQALAAKLNTLYQPREAHFSKQNGQAYYVARLEAHGFEIEFFAQDKPTSSQNGYRHMQMESRLLVLAGNEARQTIRQLKANGMKTEPAFAHYFKLAGNPYDALLELENHSDNDLLEIIKNAK